MIKPENIPSESIAAFVKVYEGQRHPDDWIQASIAAAINAWPGMYIGEGFVIDMNFRDIILPLPDEEQNDAA